MNLVLALAFDLLSRNFSIVDYMIDCINVLYLNEIRDTPFSTWSQGAHSVMTEVMTVFSEEIRDSVCWTLFNELGQLLNLSVVFLPEYIFLVGSMRRL